MLFLLLVWIILMTLHISYNLDVISIEYNYLSVGLLTSFAEYFLRLEFLALLLIFSQAQYTKIMVSDGAKKRSKNE